MAIGDDWRPANQRPANEQGRAINDMGMLPIAATADMRGLRLATNTIKKLGMLGDVPDHAVPRQANAPDLVHLLRCRRFNFLVAMLHHAPPVLRQ
eukprot:2351776-Pyramimonas_sp.AAC.1